MTPSPSRGTPTCAEVRGRILEHQRGQIDPAEHAAVLAHFETCAACAREDAAERALTEALERRLPQHPASLALKRQLAAQWPGRTPAALSWWGRWRHVAVPVSLAAALLLAVLPLYFVREAADETVMVREAVNDHLRVVSAQSPLEVRSGGIHQVKPWFEGRLDFAPVVRFAGDEEFPLQGGAVGYFLDRKAAVFVFNRRLHRITLLVFRAEGLPWASTGTTPMGDARAHVAATRGFNTVLWRAGELGYALVSDVDAGELLQLGAKLARDS
jgi:anti-sigma factor RsiW